MITLGVTGTVNGATIEQAATLWQVMSSFEFSHFHHGDAIGVDELAHTAALAIKKARGDGYPKIAIHPADRDSKRAYCRGGDIIHESFPYLTRDDHIAASSQVLIAVPLKPEEWIRSGTWATVRRARKYRRLVIRINPDGEIKVG